MTTQYIPVISVKKRKMMLANVYFFTFYLDTNVTVNALHPGVVKTELGRHLPIAKSYISSFLLKPIMWLLLKTPSQGAQTTLYCALAAELDGVTGKYLWLD